MSSGKLKRIDTAPKDGTEVEVVSKYAPDFPMGKAAFKDGAWRTVINTVPVIVHPTHWRPSIN